MLRILSIFAKWLFVLCLPCLLLSASIWWAANSHWLYTSGFDRHDVSTATGLNTSELDRIATEMIDYFNSPDDYVNITVSKNGQSFELFTEEETIHFYDVKKLFRLDFYVLLVTGIYIFGYAVVSLIWRRPRYRRGLAKATIIGSGITLALMLLLVIGSLIDFDRLWLQFHFFSFSNEFWSAKGYMLLLFPGGFWFDAVTYCAIAMAGAAVILSGAASGYLLATRKTPTF